MVHRGRRSPHTVLDGGEYRYAREGKDVDVQLLLIESFGGFGKGVGEILWKAANAAEQAGPVPRRGDLDNQEYIG